MISDRPERARFTHIPPLVRDDNVIGVTVADQIKAGPQRSNAVGPPARSGGWHHGAMKSRLRKLHIDGREYTWKADVRAAPGPDGRRHRCIRIRVWGGGKTSCALQADLIENGRPGQTEESYPYPAAADVRVLIDYGLRAGWGPGDLGGTFQVTSQADVTLPGFVLTDVLWTAGQPQT